MNRRVAENQLGFDFADGEILENQPIYVGEFSSDFPLPISVAEAITQAPIYKGSGPCFVISKATRHCPLPGSADATYLRDDEDGDEYWSCDLCGWVSIWQFNGESRELLTEYDPNNPS